MHLKTRVLQNTKFPYMIELPDDELGFNSEWTMIVDWCTEQFGNRHEDDATWMVGYNKIRFSNEQDKNWVILKWMD